MTTRRAELGELETLVLLAVLRLGAAATGMAIRDEVATRGGRQLSRGATYATLSRLGRKGFLEPLRRPETATSGRATNHFQVTEEGLAVLRTAQRNLLRMRSGLEAILDAG